jgi:hypothetical protein
VTNFHCREFPRLKMPRELQRGFCAKQYRKENAVCLACRHGQRAVEEDTETIRAALPADTVGNVAEGTKRAWEVKKFLGKLKRTKRAMFARAKK